MAVANGPVEDRQRLTETKEKGVLKEIVLLQLYKNYGG
jgi:hypothetical protein